MSNKVVLFKRTSHKGVSITSVVDNESGAVLGYEVNERALTIAKIQDWINQCENKKIQLANDYAKALFKSPQAAFIFADMIAETAKINAYKECTGLLLGK